MTDDHRRPGLPVGNHPGGKHPREETPQHVEDPDPEEEIEEEVDEELPIG